MDRVFYIIASLYLFSLVASIAYVNAALFAFSVLMLTIGVIAYKAWYIIEPVIFRHSNIVEVLNGYELSGDRSAAIRKLGNGFSATSVALLDTSQTSSLEREKLESIIERAEKPFKLAMVVAPINTSRIINELKTKRYIKEAQLSRLSRGKADEARGRQIKRELDEIESNIVEITSGKVPLKILYYVMYAAVSESVTIAKDSSISGLGEISAAFDSALNSKSSILNGKDLIDVLSFDSTIIL